MKKFLGSILAMVLVFSMLVPMSMAEPMVPAPFESAKALAVKVSPDQDGNQILEIPGTGIHSTLTFIMVYIPDGRIIGVGASNGMEILVWMYCETDQTFSAYYNGQVGPVTEEKAIAGAFSIFRMVVTQDAI